MKEFTITVPCKTYIRKYFNYIYGEEITLNHGDDFSDTILSKISHKPYVRLSKQDLNIAFRYNTDKLIFKLPIDFFYRAENELNEQMIYSINRYLQNIFETDLFIIVNIGAAFGVEKRISCEVFARKHNLVIDKDITLDAMIQAEYRERTYKHSKNKFLVALSGLTRRRKVS